MTPYMERENSTVHECFDFHLEAEDPSWLMKFDFDHIPVHLVRFQGGISPSHTGLKYCI